MSSPTLPTELRRRRLFILAGLWLSAAALLLFFRSVVMPFAGAALIAYLVAPLVDRFTRLRIGGRHPPRWLAILAIYAAFFLSVYLVALALVPQLYRELARISREALDAVNALTPERVEDFARRAERFLSTYLPGSGDADDGSGVHLEELVRGAASRVATEVQHRLGDVVAVARRLVTGVLAGIFMLFFILMVAAFLSIDARNISRYFAGLVPPEYAEDAGLLIRRIDRSLAGVVRGQVTICVVNGILTFIGLVLFEVKFAFLLATIATVFSLIPIFGTIISSVPIVLIGLSQSWQTGLAALLWIIGIHAVEAYVLNPKIMGSAARIHPVIVAFSLIAGERMYGLVGALFAVPVAAIVVACFDFARQKAQGELSSSELPAAPSAVRPSAS